MKLYLIGLPGSGKSFLGKQLADEMKLPFIDLDKVIEHEAGTSTAKIFLEKGEDYFRTLEARALRQQSKKPEFVMACGGGTPCFNDNMKFMNETGNTIFINTSVKTIVKRLSSEVRRERPLLAESEPMEMEEKIKSLLSKRNSFYTQANIVVMNPSSASDIIQHLRNG